MIKNKLWLFIIVTSILSMALIVVGCTGGQSPTAPTTTTPSTIDSSVSQLQPGEKPIVLKAGHYSGLTEIRHEMWLHWAELVKQRSGGRLEIEVHGASTLVAITGQVAAMRKNLADLTPVYASIQPELSFSADVTTIAMPHNWENQIDFGRELVDLLQPEFNSVGIVGLWWQDCSDDQQWWFKSPVIPGAGADVFKNKIIRSIGPATDSLIKNLGGSSCQIPGNEFYNAAQQGTVDGCTFGTATFSGLGFWPVMPHMVIAPVLTSGAIPAITKKAWDSLTPELQKILLDTGWETAQWLKEPYERANQMYVGAGCFKYGGSCYVLNDKEIKAWLEAAKPWNQQMKTKYPDLFPKFEALINKYK